MIWPSPSSSATRSAWRSTPACAPSSSSSSRRPCPAIVETVPSFRSLLVYYDPARLGYDALCETLGDLAEQAGHRRAAALAHRRAAVLLRPRARSRSRGGRPAARRSPSDELVRLHAGAEYLVYFIGFTPGLPYMAGVPERIRLPRLETPRTKVPPGSVGLGGVQFCIYSVESPGGYWLLGRTPAASLRSDGRRADAPARGRPRAVAPDRPRGVRRHRRARRGARLAAGDRMIRIVEPGPADDGAGSRTPRSAAPRHPALGADGRARVRDRQSPGRQRRRRRRARVHADGAALQRGGAVRHRRHRRRRAGHRQRRGRRPPHATLVLRSGDVVRIGAARAGVRAYVAFSGGIDVPPVLGSRATYLRGRLGGLEGRSLKREDVLRLLARRSRRRARCPPRTPRRSTPSPRSGSCWDPTLERFTDEGVAAFLGGPYEMLPAVGPHGRASARPAHRAHPRPRHHLRRHRARHDPGPGRRTADRAAGRPPVDGRLHEAGHRVLVRHRSHRAGQARAARALPGDRGGRGAPSAPIMGSVTGRRAAEASSRIEREISDESGQGSHGVRVEDAALAQRCTRTRWPSCPAATAARRRSSIRIPSTSSAGTGRTWDADGNDRLDFNGNYTSLILGHAPPEVVQAVQERRRLGAVVPRADRARDPAGRDARAGGSRRSRPCASPTRAPRRP